MAPSIKLAGTPFSTFTRTIALGLHHKGIQFEQIKTPPQSDIASKYHPFGYLPSLIIDDSTVLVESQAIARYIERTAPSPSLELPATTRETGVLDEKVWEFVSLVASFGFPALEGGVIKPYVKLLDDPQTKGDIPFNPEDEGVTKAKEFLSIIESRMVPGAKYAFGDGPTWGDFYLYPILADLRSIPAWQIASQRLEAWMTTMDELEAVQKTQPGTLALGGRP
ncbi:hypothetical protein BKA70DRAFT_1374025 [Coprinopsis sp. MPI-PUGE-AT-0042]|nr:hypothetical protein BKA70DRAFT_1374025 [Coprinopsis sp. MPI-PUGE-AT-0042]